MRAAAERDGATLTIVRVPFPIEEPSQAVEAYLEAVTPRTRFALVSHVTSPTALVLPIEAIVRELDRRGVDTLVDAAHAPGMVEVDLGRARRGVLDGERAQVAVRAQGRRAAPRPRRPPAADPAARRLARRATRPRTDRSRYRLEFDWTGTDDPSRDPRPARGAALRGRARRRRLARLHGDQPLDGAPRPGPAVRGARRAAARPGLDDRLDGLGAAAGARADARRGRAAPGRAATTRSASRSRSSSSRCRPPSPAARPAQALVRISAQRYNRTEEYARLAESLARRLRGPTSPRALLGRLRKG